MKRCSTVAALVAVLGLVGCSSAALDPLETTVVEDAATPTPTAATPTAATPSAAPTPNGNWAAPKAGRQLDAAAIEAALPGYWTGDWGEMLFRVEDDGSVIGAYGFREGLMFGSIDGEVIHGWWCEAPDYSLPDRAGPVEFRLLENPGW